MTRTGGSLRALGWAALALAAGPAAAAEDTRRAGTLDMSPALRAMQADRDQHPAQLWVAQGRALFVRRDGVADRACADCHSLGTASSTAATRPVGSAAARHPAWDNVLARPLTLGQRIAQCRLRHQRVAGPTAGDTEVVLALQALLADTARGSPIEPPADARLAPWRARGAALYRQRIGQLDLACADCHDAQAGRSLGGSIIPQGHPTGYPIYRLQWQTLGDLTRRLRGCVTGVRAEPWAADAPEWVQLELHLMQRAVGMPWEGAALRP
jgi:sulfur-oxidizing protein SoxA